MKRALRAVLPFLIFPLSIAAAASLPIPPTPVAASTSTVTPIAPPSGVPSGNIVVVHPWEGARLPPISSVFVFGNVPPGSTMTLNGAPVLLHRKGGFLTMYGVKPGDQTLSFEARTPSGDILKLDRHFYIASGFTPLPTSPVAIERGTVSPSDELLMTAGDTLRVSFQGSPGGQAEFSIQGMAQHIPMVELGTFPSKNNVVVSSGNTRGLYEGTYVLQPWDKASKAVIEVSLKRSREPVRAKATGKLTVESGGSPHVGLILEDTVAARTGPEGGYDIFLSRGMRVRLTGRVGNQWRVALSSIQSGWVKGSALQELPRGAPAASSMLTNFSMLHQEESTLIKIPLGEVLPYRVEQLTDPNKLILTLYGAVDKTELIKYDPTDPLLRQVRWRQIAPDTAQLVIEPSFEKWWGYDVRYEGTTLYLEIRKPWQLEDIRGMIIAVDPGHGGSDKGAMGPHETLEKEANLQIARVVVQALERAGAKPFLTRDKDVDVPLYERPRIAWRNNARLFVSIHCNAAGEGENPLFNNGFSIYSYQPQSLSLARSVHNAYSKSLGLPDHGLYYADLAVCRMTQMPAILTEQAYIIVPEQEELIFNPEFHRKIAASIVNGIRAYLGKP